MRKTIFTLTVLSLLCFTTCKKDKPSSKLPPITQEGKNTVGFKVNGKVWTPFFECRYFDNPCGEISARYGHPNLEIGHFGFNLTRRVGDKHSSFGLGGVEPITTVGDKYAIANFTFRGENSRGTTDSWRRSWSASAPPGIFEITKIDMDNQIISGIFSFTLYEENNSGRTIEITEGRFDFKMNAVFADIRLFSFCRQSRKQQSL